MIRSLFKDRVPILHPFLLAIYPTLALLSQNLTEISPAQANRLFPLSLLLATLSFLLFRWIFRDPYRAGLMTSLVLILFFSYGHLYLFFRGQTFPGFLFFRHRNLILLWMAVGALGFWILARRSMDELRWTRILNLVALVVVTFPIYSITSFLIANRPSQQFSSQSTDPTTGSALAFEGQSLPDVYYIILDAYGRDDILLDHLEYDNSAFIEYLQDRGFYVAAESNSNYTWTHYSLTSSLYMDYIQNIEVPPRGNIYVAMSELIADSLVHQQFEQLGYSSAAVQTVSHLYWFSEMEDADYYFPAETRIGERQGLFGGINSLEGLAFETSMGRLIADSLEAAGSDWLSARMEEPYALHRSVVLSAFEHLEQGPSIPGPTFFFAHIILPHPPFIFGPNGERRTPKNYFTLAEQPGPQYFTFEELPGASSQLGPYDPYLDQVSFVNSRMEEVIDLILTSSETPPIIIIQGDHGPDLDLYREGNSPSDRYLERRGPILNAYLLPGDCADQLYPSVTPVNTFRIIFNCYFNGQYELLEDRSYWSTRTDNPPDFVEYE